MRIVCPSCEAEYDVPEAMLSGRRNVRCAKCAREWAPFAPPPAPPPPPPPPEPVAAAPEPMAEPAEPSAPRPAPAAATLADHAPPIVPPKPRKTAKVPGSAPSLGVVIAWLLTAALIAAAIGVLWLKRAQVVSFFPPARRLYVLFGLDF
jgi:predicted Zn finger-like uncharacterized protein